jgi:hypothetical protein
VGDDSLRGWLIHYGDWLVATILMALGTSSVVGWRKRSNGIALLMSHISSGILAIFLFVIGRTLKYDPLTIVVVAGPIGGSCSYAAFSLLLKLNDRLEVRGNQIADGIIDRVTGSKSEGSPNVTQ